MRLWIVSYDIADDRRRLAVERVLLALGDRLQWSVFACRLNDRGRAALQRTLAAIIDPTLDDVRAWSPCLHCRQRIVIDGAVTTSLDCGYVLG